MVENRLEDADLFLQVLSVVSADVNSTLLSLRKVLARELKFFVFPSRIFSATGNFLFRFKLKITKDF